MAGPWEKYAPKQVAKGPWEKYSQTAPEVSKAESALRGAAQGLSLGFADEVTAGLESALTDKSYDEAREESRAAYDQAQKANPITYGAGELGGGFASAFIPGLNAAKGATLAGRAAIAAGAGAASGIGHSTAEDTTGLAKDAAIGGALSGLGTVAVEKAVVPGIRAAGKWFGKGAEKLAVNATGATGNQANKFSPGAGRELLDQKLVRFADTPESIANRLSAAKEKSGQVISDALSGLDDAGATASVDDIVASLQKKVQQLKEVPGNSRTIAQIEAEIENLAGKSSLSLSAAEEAKRNFQGQVNYFSPEFEKKGATSVADAFRQEVEKKATAASPDMAKLFTDAKKQYGLLAPIEEAASKRAATLNQSPFGGLGDMVAGGVGGGLAGGPGAMASLAAKRVVMPRLASSLAITTDGISKILQKDPGALGKFGNALAQAASRGQPALSAAHFVLQNQNPEYREILRNMKEK